MVEQAWSNWAIPRHARRDTIRRLSPLHGVIRFLAPFVLTSMAKVSRPYGLWDSPISPSSLAEGRRLDGVEWDTTSDTLVWLEGRSGKGTLVALAPGDAPRDLTGELSVRAEVGYGGGDFTVHDGHVYFVVHKSGRIFRQSLAAGKATPITPAFGKAASPAVSPDGRFVAYIHHDEANVDRLAIVDSLGKQWPRIVASGADFYMQPRFSPDGRSLCWIAWDHPNMPWDGTTLWLAPIIARGDEVPVLGPATEIAGGREIAIFQPEFSPQGDALCYVSDETGWGRIAHRNLATGETKWVTEPGVEQGAPAWLQGQKTYAFEFDGKSLIATGNQNAFQTVARIDLATGVATPIESLRSQTEITSLAASRRAPVLAIIGSSPRTPPRVTTYDPRLAETRVVAYSMGETTPQASLATCEPIEWRTAGDETAHGLYYAPASERFEGVGKPPLIVLVHGGPTSQVRAGWRAEAQFFATRGYAVLYVNYRGSTGYGRAYMTRLRGNWGICDVEDSLSGKRHLEEAGRVDLKRSVIMGGSAGGFTVLQTMVVEPEAFTAGVNLYGVANQFGLAADTHKFEARYTDSLIGPLPEAAALYQERSPLFHAQRIRRPLAVFQGAIDQVVPRDQSDEIVTALARQGVPHYYHVYEGEGHGWRQRDSIEHYYQAVDRFLRLRVIFA